MKKKSTEKESESKKYQRRSKSRDSEEAAKIKEKIRSLPTTRGIKSGKRKKVYHITQSVVSMV